MIIVSGITRTPTRLQELSFLENAFQKSKEIIIIEEINLLLNENIVLTNKQTYDFLLKNKTFCFLKQFIDFISFLWFYLILIAAKFVLSQKVTSTFWQN